MDGMVSSLLLCHSGTINPHYLSGAAIMIVKTIGIDLAKEVFQVHGVDEHGKQLFNKQLKRTKMLSFFANIPPCLIDMKACASAHFWAGKLMTIGHNVRLIAPQFVMPCVKTNKHDAADTETICEAVTRPDMQFVPIKPLSSKPYWHFTGAVRVSSNNGPLRRIKFGGYWVNLASLYPGGSSSYNFSYLRYWKILITCCHLCLVHNRVCYNSIWHICLISSLRPTSKLSSATAKMHYTSVSARSRALARSPPPH